jgi:hypothetical protein
VGCRIWCDVSTQSVLLLESMMVVCKLCYVYRCTSSIHVLHHSLLTHRDYHCHFVTCCNVSNSLACPIPHSLLPPHLFIPTHPRDSHPGGPADLDDETDEEDAAVSDDEAIMKLQAPKDTYIAVGLEKLRYVCVGMCGYGWAMTVLRVGALMAGTCHPHTHTPLPPVTVTVLL